MARVRATYVCRQCGASAPKWMGRCPRCDAWSSLELAGGAAGEESGPRPLSEVAADEIVRLPSGLAELDRVLGGGAVPGGVVLLGGEPGIGKSTLLLQALSGYAERGCDVLYVTGEESASQVSLRARRLGVRRDFMLLSAMDLGSMRRALGRARYQIVAVDSIQTVRAAELEGTAGGVTQLREVAASLIELAKRGDTSMFLVGHVTKDGALAGPKVLEHLVDTVLSFEGDAGHAYRIVRATKNRFGPSQEVGVFEMAQDGLREVADPSGLFLAERPGGAAGSVVFPVVEGNRSLVVEIQALVAPALYGSPRRVATGLDTQRLSVLLAVLQRKAGIQVLDQDVFASVAGGVRVDERAVDLGVAAAIVSSLRERAIAPDTVTLGEVGLAGELRAVPRVATRLREAAKLGFRRAVMPRVSAEQLAPEEHAGMQIVGTSDLSEALETLVSPQGRAH